MYPLCTSGFIALAAMTFGGVLQKMGRFSAYGLMASLLGEEPSFEETMPFFDDPAERAELTTKAAKAAAWLVAAAVAALVCSMIYPLCLIILAMSGSLRVALFPVTWFVILRQVPLGYLGLLIALILGSGASYAVAIPLGGMVRVGSAPQNAAPGELQPDEVAGGPPVAPGGWGTPAEAPGGDEIAGLHARFQSACASRDVAAIAQSAPVLVDAYWDAGNSLGAVQVYRALIAVSPETSLGPDRQGRLAKDLETSGDLPAAMTAWRTLALSHPDHLRAPMALWRCVEICAKLDRPDWVASACQAVLARYPMSEVASMAQARLRKLGT